MKQKKPILEIKKLKKTFLVKNPLGITKAHVKAVNDVSFKLFKNEVFSLVGESGCGKTTIGRTILRLIEPTEGEAIYKERNIFCLSAKSFRNIRQELQMVFQDPYSSLNPRKRIGLILEEPLIIHKINQKRERTERVFEMLNKVGLQTEHYYMYPHEFSGGQKQRIGLARALMVNPNILICDEPVSALDVSIQSQILNLLKDLQESLELSIIFISHDLSVVRYISDHIGVMYLGKLVEISPTDSLFASPYHPYTQALLTAVPIPNPNVKKGRIKLKGDVPTPYNTPSGCFFHTRCQYTKDICKKATPIEINISTNHFVSCHLYS